MSKISSSSTASTASMDSKNGDLLEGTVSLTPDAKYALKIEDTWRGLTPIKNESYYVKKNHERNEYPIYKATTQKNGDMKVEYYKTMARSMDGLLKPIEKKEQGYEPITIEKDAVNKYQKLYGELVKAKNKEDGKPWWTRSTEEEEEEKIKSLEKELKKNPFGKLQSEMTLYVGGKKRKSRKQKKSLKRKSRKQKKSLKKRR